MRPHPALPYAAGAAIAARRLLKFSADGIVIQATAATDDLIGVSDSLGATAQGDRCDTYVGGVVEIDVGGNIGRGKPVTSDANGKAVQAAPAAGVNNRIIGFAQATYVAGDIGEFLVAPGSLQG